MVGGQAGLAGHLRIGNGARIAAKSGVMRDVERRRDGRRHAGRAGSGVAAADRGCCSGLRRRRTSDDRSGSWPSGPGVEIEHRADHGDDPAPPSVSDDRQGRRRRSPTSAPPGSRTSRSTSSTFKGHFPARPVMPGVLIIEAMAQTAAVLVVHTLGREAEGKLVYFMSVDNARFRRPVVPGDKLACPCHQAAQPRQCLEVRGQGQGRRPT